MGVAYTPLMFVNRLTRVLRETLGEGGDESFESSAISKSAHTAGLRADSVLSAAGEELH